MLRAFAQPAAVRRDGLHPAPGSADLDADRGHDLHALLGPEPPSLEDLVVNTFLRPQGLPFLVFGTAVGAVFAGLVFAISAVSLPMLLDRPLDVMTAIVTSVRAVTANPRPMLLWAALIVGFTGAGLITLYLGLIVTVPLIGYATWHAYKDLVPLSGEPS